MAKEGDYRRLLNVLDRCLLNYISIDILLAAAENGNSSDIPALEKIGRRIDAGPMNGYLVTIYDQCMAALRAVEAPRDEKR